MDKSPFSSRPSLAATIGYIVWLVILTRFLSLAIGNSPPSIAESLGQSSGLALVLLVVFGIFYWAVRLYATRHAQSTPWLLTMLLTTVIALLLTAGGFYGRLNSFPQQSSAQRSTAQPPYGSNGWTEENTGIDIFDPFQAAPPPGTRYYRDAEDIIYKVYPPGVRPDLPPANPFGVGDSTVGAPPPR
jgi:hypothetical protein